MPARNAARHPAAQGDGPPAGGPQATHQRTRRGTRRAEARRRAQLPALVVRPEGAAQVALLGPAQLRQIAAACAADGFRREERAVSAHDAVSRARDAAVGGRALPARGPAAGLGASIRCRGSRSTLQSADAACWSSISPIPIACSRSRPCSSDLKQRKVSLVTAWPGDAPQRREGARRRRPTKADVFAVRLPTLLVANKADLLAHADDRPGGARRTRGTALPDAARLGRDGAGARRARRRGCGRRWASCASTPRRQASPRCTTGRSRLRRGEQTVGDVARLVHRDMAKTLKYARVWGLSVVAEGQHVGRDHALADRDVVELHT